MNQVVINGNNIEILKKYPDNYFDAVVTDPPYGLGKEPNAAELMKDWIEHGYHEISGKGFMGKEWDAFVPQPIFWKEVFRVLKHGGHVVSFFGTRTYDWGVMAMRFAGFEVRDCIQWLYGSGFPKSHNISKAIDKLHGAEREVVGERVTGTMNNKGGASVNADGSWDSGQKTINVTKAATEQAKKWDGWGTALKPANEPIVLARKPLEKGLSVAENVLKWGTGGINIDASRVGSETIKGQKAGQGFNNVKGFGVNTKLGDENAKEYISDDVNGRFPANLIMSHHPECECKGTKKVKGMIDKPTNRTEKGNTWDEENSGLRKNMPKNSGGFGDADGNETVEDWECHEDCPIRILDEQSGVLKSGAMKKSYEYVNNGYSIGKPSGATKQIHEASMGGASRFFYCAKASKSERNEGLDGFEEKIIEGRDKGQGAMNVAYKPRPTPMSNIHPTVKPIKLMQYLVKLVTPPNGIVLDPFCGSGTTGVACKLDGFHFVGIEQDPEYTKIAEARINANNNKGEQIKESEPKSDKKEEQPKPIQSSLF